MLPLGVLLLWLLVVCEGSSLVSKHQQPTLLVSVDGFPTGSANPIQHQYQRGNQPTSDSSGGSRFVGLINDANFAGQPWFGASGLVLGPQSKRARKMSAFMPMRGRKDGRDADFIDQANIYHENDAEPSLIRFLGAGSGAGSMESGGSMGSEFGRLKWLGPREFALRNQQANLENVYELAGDQLDPTPQVMQAKLRRAFHPMRGKKSNVVDSSKDSDFAALAEELGI